MTSHEELMSGAEAAAQRSTRSGRKVGCVLALGGCAVVAASNNPPEALAALPLPEHKKDVCAEVWALYFLPRIADPPNGALTLYVWPIPPCPSCTLSILANNKITCVVVPAPDPAHPVLGDRWKERWAWSKALLIAEGIDVIELEKKGRTLWMTSSR